MTTSVSLGMIYSVATISIFIYVMYELLGCSYLFVVCVYPLQNSIAAHLENQKGKDKGQGFKKFWSSLLPLCDTRLNVVYSTVQYFSQVTTSNKQQKQTFFKIAWQAKHRNTIKPSIT